MVVFHIKRNGEVKRGIKMSWEEVIKGHRTRTGKTRTKKKKKQFHRREGERPRVTNTDPFLDDPELDEEEFYLAEKTREDLMDMVMDKIGQMSREELIALLIKTKGDLKEVDLS